MESPNPSVLANLRFKKGDTVELKSLEDGYRGAWFSCKIMAVKENHDGEPVYRVMYLDYDNEKEHWVPAYCFNPSMEHVGNKGFETMLRPMPPPFHKMADRRSKLEPTGKLILQVRPWDIGDLVDWKKDGCWWQGKITKTIKSCVEISLPEPPVGEGESYCARSRDLRPSMLWDMETNMWSLPAASKRGAIEVPCAKMLDLPMVPPALSRTGERGGASNSFHRLSTGVESAGNQGNQASLSVRAEKSSLTPPPSPAIASSEPSDKPPGEGQEKVKDDSGAAREKLLNGSMPEHAITQLGVVKRAMKKKQKVYSILLHQARVRARRGW